MLDCISLTLFNPTENSNIVIFQVLLSKEDLKMMIDEISGKDQGNHDEDCPRDAVNLRSFLLIMENSAW
jgi:hypothetical protein